MQLKRRRQLMTRTSKVMVEAEVIGGVTNVPPLSR